MTDIVEKEMYSFEDSMNGEKLTLRPENTSAVVRCAIEHSLTYNAPQRLWYFGPMFRHERPQRGRYRQFHQFGCEALGFAGPDIDVELLAMIARLWKELGIRARQAPRGAHCVLSAKRRYFGRRRKETASHKPPENSGYKKSGHAGDGERCAEVT